MTHPKVLAMARRICADVRPDYAAGFLSGEFDTSSTEIRTAIAAIERVTVLADLWLSHDLDDWPDYVAPSDLAVAVARFDHLPEPAEDTTRT
jgi:hypothetical protein